MISSTLLTLLPRRPNHFQSDETASASFNLLLDGLVGILGGLSRSGGTVGQSGGGLGAHLERSGVVLGGLGAVWGRSWAILGRLGVVLSASGEATGDHDGSKRLKEDLLEAKNRPRRPAGGQDFSKKPFWCHFVVHFWGLFLHIFGSKIGSEIGSVF